ncbi:Rossmann-like and DUF2520 domain-containing protein [Bacteroides sp. 519]|uniref:Rossmann-like and DUF2520 domain-containing protein n=1 Tax=Bacteroides sp. 519 TaxID=2302937 RepID=UPI0013D4E1D8|nr:Rossmann-like and DUF2520 domain-containing protein [Bacteroides sp. 519]NDV59997.1 DUF2520 domain-containing protein [Bacteroides sp. 519]
MVDNKQDIPVAVIGAGNLGYNLALTLHKHGFHVIQIYSRTEESAKPLALQVEAEWTTNSEKITNKAAIYFVALKDSVLEEIIPQLIKERKSALWVHTAGSIPMDIWEPHCNRYGVFYPMQTFSKKREVSFNELSIFIEAFNKNDIEILRAIALSLTSKVYEIDSDRRKKLHLAAVYACNFVNHMYTLSSEVLKSVDIPFDAMLPLVDETARKVHELPPQEAQTGPAVRYDRNVIDSHLEMLNDTPDMQDIYRLISQSIYNHTITQNSKPKTQN